ncbi:MAG: hypothetical protein ACLFSB_10410 [Chitinispirillaceae bacterium]
MEILICSTTLDSEPFIGRGEKSAGQRICTGVCNQKMILAGVVAG